MTIRLIQWQTSNKVSGYMLAI